ncbi:hypothetical protein DACRYDRAFT_116497 [Dacryopinax primogenitus]|uniref:RRM domain-containing protein n=1 Tax=Dacryopinax primogenitus (strain DJM 731) TaxID=1858805 RepID=M5G652_DACPD|nr:uncharacterized protein DACRYDRAFT_116497 [Dacryopinax primogenitus]EJU01307.1 hypothetical protein DACRYDRAFT_116497 [Dacryopinax primogenitus]
MAHPDSRVVFVGNIPYGMTEEALIEVFRTVGPVVGFRLVFDRETGKPKGYGFCEFPDHETAMSAVRNLHGYEVQGRPLRVDIAESDPMVEGKTTHQGVINERDVRADSAGHGGRWGPPKNDFANFMNDLPSGVSIPPGKSSLDVISQALASIPHPQLMQTLNQMKAYVGNYPDRARALLVAHPQLSYAFFQAMLMNKIVDPAILERMLKATTQSAAPPLPTPAPPPPQPQMYPPPMQQQPAQYPPPQSYYGMPPPPVPQAVPPPTPAPAAAVAAAPLPADQRAMLMQVLSLSQEQVNALPPTERAAIMQLRSQFAGVLHQ